MSLSGHWTGVYDYPANMMEPTPFTAIIHDDGATFYGEILEPNLNDFGDSVPYSEIHADITGQYDGIEVSFIKEYPPMICESLGQVRYVGSINADFTKIKGVWTTVEAEPWSGPFVMNRIQAKTRSTSIKKSEELLIK